jgi:tetratricopeptide (TPR) repeat protein
LVSKKDKLLESAQRFVLKGQIDKAIRDYQQVVALEPKEIRHRQRLAQLLVRDSRKEEAIAQYEDIGKHYADNSYFLKAIAVYKQIQRLAPGETAVSLTIASLNNRQGLIGNALAEYGLVVAQLEKEGDLKEALKVLEQMLAIDGEQAAMRLKYAELLFASGAEALSCQAFSALLATLSAAGDAVAVQRLSDRMRKLFPGQQELDPGRLPARLAAGELDGPRVSLQPVAPDPGAFGPASSVVDVPDPVAAPGPFGTPRPSDAPGNPPAAELSDPAKLASPWEEEIELDLDLDDDPPDTALAAPPDIDLSLDFSLSLEFDEEEQLAPTPPGCDGPSGTGSSSPSAEISPFGEFPPLVGSSPFAEASPVNDASCCPDCFAASGDLPQPLAGPEREEDGPLELNWPEESETLAQTGSRGEGAKAQELLQSCGARQPRGWQEIFPDSVRPAEAAVDPSELESHYDLGIAYKEMGLYGDAIREFAVAAGNPRRRLDCLTLQAICYREKGEPGKAEELLQQGRSLEVLSVEERMSLSYELAFLLETTGEMDEAIGLYREVHGVNPDFHDVAARLSSLAGDDPLDIIELELEEDG